MNKTILGFVAMALFAVQLVHAAGICSWTGAGADANWSTDANWNCVTIPSHNHPGNGDIIAFADGKPRLGNTNNLSNLIVSHLILNGLNYNIDGNPIQLTAGITGNPPAGNPSDFGPNVNLAITLTADGQSVQNDGLHAIGLNGTLDMNGHAVTVSGAGNVALGNITGAGGITKTGTGKMFLEGGASDETGTTTLNDGETDVLVSSAFGLGAAGPGNGTVVGNGATLTLHIPTAAEDLTLSGAGFNSLGALHHALFNTTLTGTITLAANATITTFSANAVLTLAGPVGGSFTLTKEGAGVLRLENVNTYTDTSVNAGTLEVNGTLVNTVDVLATGTLAGAGVCGTIVLSGTITPGKDAGTRPGTLDVSNLQWSGAGQMAFQLGRTSVLSDQLAISGDFEASGAAATHLFRFSDAATPPVPGVAYTLVTFVSNTGFLDSDFTFAYTGTGPGSSMTGTFALTATELRFTPSAVTSDLIFRDGLD